MTRTRALDGKRILVVEDDYYLATDQKALLERQGAEVLGPFGRDNEAQALVAAQRIDAALIDINLGTGPSFDLARVLHGRGIPFVFVTGYDAAQIPADLAEAPRIEKPVRERALIETVARVAGV